MRLVGACARRARKNERTPTSRTTWACTVHVARKVDAGKVTAASHFINDLGLDSLDAVEVVMAFEDEFVIEIPDNEAEKIQTCADAINFVAAHPQAK